MYLVTWLCFYKWQTRCTSFLFSNKLQSYHSIWNRTLWIHFFIMNIAPSILRMPAKITVTYTGDNWPVFQNPRTTFQNTPLLCQLNNSIAIRGLFMKSTIKLENFTLTLCLGKLSWEWEEVLKVAGTIAHDLDPQLAGHVTVNNLLAGWEVQADCLVSKVCTWKQHLLFYHHSEIVWRRYEEW